MTKIRRVFLSGLAGISVLCACVTHPVPPVSVPVEAGPAERRLIRTEPELKPDWKDAPPKTGEELFFVGVSRFFSAAADARNDARENAFRQVMRFYGEFIQSGGVERNYVSGSSSETIAALVNREEEISNFAQAVVSRIGTDRYYTEIYLNGQNREEYVVYALCQIPRQKAEQDIADFAKNTSGRYGSLLVTPSSLHAALLMYGDILAALERNPLHRAVAYYDGPDGRVNLYEYLGLQLNTLAGSVSFAPLSPAEVEKTGVLDATVTVYSPLIALVGALDCGVSIYGMNNPSPTVKYTVRADNSFFLKIFTSRLEPGRYTVRLELLLSEISPRIRKNPSESFSLEVKPLPAAVDFVVSGGSIGGPEKNAFVQEIQQGIRNYGVPVNLKTDRTEPGGNVFTVALAFREQAPPPPLTAPLAVCEVTISFFRGGQAQESASKRIVEFDAPGAVEQARKFIRENELFFRNVTKRLSQ